ncbi:hypothetical protein OTU49_012382 [Cherax quadricarinatus]|uniref:Uncharacterized protein n=1 Tax=Cherax quadricarinatus TaxID=27406 RepID=A0AAW0VY51_CHEQU
MTDVMDLYKEAILRPGQGMLLSLSVPGGDDHGVALYRCMDGFLIYYDSAHYSVPPQLWTYLLYNRFPKHLVKIVDLAKQGDVDSCAYHAITFLDIVTSCNLHDHDDVILYYDMTMGKFPDLTAVLRVYAILREFESDIKLYTNDSDSLLEPDTKLSSRLEIIHRKRQRKVKRLQAQGIYQSDIKKKSRRRSRFGQTTH